MGVTQRGIDLIKKWEGFRGTAYKCPAGIWTIGYGHTAGVKEGDTITKEEAENLLKEEVQKYNKYVMAHASAYGWNQNQIDALTSFTYNLGAGNLEKLIDGRTNDVIAQKMLLYCKSNGQTLQGLVNRRKEEAALFTEPPEDITDEVGKILHSLKNLVYQLEDILC